jgi:glutaredoxin
MNKKIIFSTALFLFASSAAVFILAGEKNIASSKQPEPGLDAEIMLYYGVTCPHCVDLDVWIEANKIKEKVVFGEKEIFQNEENRQELLTKAKICNIAEESVGVPFLWTGSACLVGNDDIIKFFEDKIRE